MLALVIVNWNYDDNLYEELSYPEDDGEIMEKILKLYGYGSVHVVQNTNDIQNCVKKFTMEHRLKEVERVHFHYSGAFQNKATIT